MAVISEYCEDSDIKEDIKKCSFCGENILKGGFWHGDEIVACCNDDASHLIDLYLDTEKDMGIFDTMSIEEQIVYVNTIVSERILKKAKIENMNKLRRAMEKMGFLYYEEIGIIDFWQYSMSKNEVIDKINNNQNSDDHNNITKNDVELCHNEIISIIKKETGEEPYIIGYFSIPDFSNYNFDIYCAAKIENNGSTFVFSNNKRLLKFLDIDGEGSKIKEIKNY